MAAGTAELGPGDGTVEVRTYREGLAQKVGHDLLIDVGAWSAKVETGADGALAAVAFDADTTSLHVREGHNGVKPLSDKDRDEIRKTIDAKILHGRPISFRSTSVEGSKVTGDLTIDGTTRPATFALELGDGRVRGVLPVVQTEFGIKPYKGLMGALKVRDQIDVALDVRI